MARGRIGSSATVNLATALAPVVDFVFPPRCPLCGDAVSEQAGLCAACWGELVIPGEPSCTSCARPFDESVASGSICAPCLAEPPRHDGIAAATLYNEASRKLVLAFKHGNRLGLSRLMARLMAAQLAVQPTVRGETDWLIVPVPLHRWRIWRRGYNQAAVLAAELAKSTGGTLCVDALERNRPTASLGGLGRLARRRELVGAIRVPAGRVPKLRGRNVLLVDDVLTSGATSEACVKVLRRAGAERVVITCFARVLDEVGGTR